MNRLPFVILPAATILLALAACASPNNAGQSTTSNPPGTGSTIAPMNAADSSQLREKAAAILIQVASTPAKEPANDEERAQYAATNTLRSNAIEALLSMPGRLEPILRSALNEKSIGMRSVAAIAAGKARIRGLVDAVQPLTAEQSPPIVDWVIVQASSAFALERCSSQADLSIIAAMLASNNTRYKAHAAYLLGELGNRSAVPMLTAAAAKPSPNGYGIRDKIMRLQIAEALIKLGKTEALDEVRAALFPGQAEDIEATALAIQIIGQVRDTDSLPQLQNLIADGYKSNNPTPVELRLAAAANFLRMSQAPVDRARAIGFAETYIADPSPAIRSQVAAAFGEARSSQLLPRLNALMADRDEQVRIAAAAAVLKITDGR